MEWAKEILKLNPKANKKVINELVPAAMAEFPTPAKRLLFSAMDCVKFKSPFGLQLLGWEKILALGE